MAKGWILKGYCFAKPICIRRQAERLITCLSKSRDIRFQKLKILIMKGSEQRPSPLHACHHKAQAKQAAALTTSKCCRERQRKWASKHGQLKQMRRDACKTRTVIPAVTFAGGVCFYKQLPLLVISIVFQV